MREKIGKLQRWTPGEPLSASRLNQTIDRVDRLTGLLPPRLLDNPERALRADEDSGEDQDESETIEDATDLPTDEEQFAAGVFYEAWEFVNKTTRTVRITDDDDPDTYVDVTVTTSVLLLRPDGTLLRLNLE